MTGIITTTTTTQTTAIQKTTTLLPKRPLEVAKDSRDPQPLLLKKGAMVIEMVLKQVEGDLVLWSKVISGVKILVDGQDTIKC